MKEINIKKDQAFWIGCDERVKVPDHLKEKWKDKAYPENWKTPTVVFNGDLEEEKSILVVLFLRDDTTPVSSRIIALRKVHKFEDFPQEEEFNVPEPD